MTPRPLVRRLACASVLLLGLTALAGAQTSPEATETPAAPAQKASAKPGFAGTPAGPGGRGEAAREHAQEQGKKTGQSAAEEKAEKAKAAKAKQDKVKAPKAKGEDLKKKGGKS